MTELNYKNRMNKPKPWLENVDNPSYYIKLLNYSYTSLATQHNKLVCQEEFAQYFIKWIFGGEFVVYLSCESFE